MSDRDVVIAGNWKMYKTAEEAASFIGELKHKMQPGKRKVYLGVPFTAIHVAAKAAAESDIVIGAQNIHDEPEGAFTGEISGRMLREAGAQFVILGHSERRHVFNESSEFVNRKVKRALLDDLQPIVCIGETQQEREAENTEKVLEKQLAETLRELTDAEMEKIIIAYEPVWAIGTGLTATPEQAKEMHRFCRDYLAKNWSETVAKKMVILYGGSVKPNNVKELMEQNDIDGVLVGGASLSAETFSQIINF